MASVVVGHKALANVVVRASAALPAAGAYDTAASTGVALLDADAAGIICTYTRGAASGAAKIKVLASVDNGTTYAPVLITDPTSYSSGTQTFAVADFKLPVSSGATAENFVLPPIDVSGYTHLQILGAEYGQTGTPGTLVITAALRRAVR